MASRRSRACRAWVTAFWRGARSVGFGISPTPVRKNWKVNFEIDARTGVLREVGLGFFGEGLGELDDERLELVPGLGVHVEEPTEGHHALDVADPEPDALAAGEDFALLVDGGGVSAQR